MTPETIRQLVAEGKSAAEIGALYGKTRRAIIGYVLKNKLGPWLTRSSKAYIRPIPDDFLVVGPTKPFHSLCQHYKAGIETMRRWIDESGVKPALRTASVVMTQSEVVERVGNMSIAQAAKELDIDRRAAAQLMRNAGLKVGRVQPEKKKTQVKAPSKSVLATWKPPTMEYIRDLSTAGLAADFLQRLGPVTRCDLHGRPIKDGQFWRRGSTVLTDGELIARARDRGWEPPLI